MRLRFQNPKIKFYIEDIRDRSSVDDAMSDVDYVFHAAAL
jgi:FlaA1/EpsC-like NDP-sugar epimerase